MIRVEFLLPGSSNIEFTATYAYTRRPHVHARIRIFTELCRSWNDGVRAFRSQ